MVYKSLDQKVSHEKSHVFLSKSVGWQAKQQLGWALGIAWTNWFGKLLGSPHWLLGICINSRCFDPVLDPMWRQGMFVIPFMTHLGITNLWGGWNITGGTIMNLGIWSYEGVNGAYIEFSGLFFLATIWNWVYWDLEIFYDECIGKTSLDLPKFFGIHLFLAGVTCFLSIFTSCSISSNNKINMVISIMN